MNDGRIILGSIPSGINVVALRRTLGHKGIVLASSCALIEGQLSREIRERLSRFDPKKESEVILVLPRRQVVLKYLTLPSVNPDEIRRMVDLQIGQGLPFSAAEIVYQISVGEADSRGYSRVVIAVARRQVVEECFGLAVKSNLNPGRCVVSAFGILAWHVQNFPLDAGRTVLVVDADSDGLEMCLCRNHKLLFARSIAFANDEPSFDDVIKQVQLTLDAFAREYPSQKVEKILLLSSFLTGADHRTAFLKEIFSQALQVPLEESSIHIDILKKGGHGNVSFCACLGMALAEDLGPDLTPASVLSTKFRREQRLALMRLSIAIVFMVGVLSVAVGLSLHRQAGILDVTRQKLAKIKQEAQNARRKIQFFDLIRSNMDNRILIAELMKELYRVIPQSTALSSIQFSDGALTIQGQTKESSDVNSVQKSMMDSLLFKDVTLQYANRPQRLAMQYTEFKILCRLRTRGEAQP